MRQTTIYSNKIPAVSVAVHIISRGQSSCLQTHFSVSISFIHSKRDFSFSGKKRKPERMLDGRECESEGAREREGKYASGWKKRKMKNKLFLVLMQIGLEPDEVWCRKHFWNYHSITDREWRTNARIKSVASLRIRAAGDECPSIRCSSLRFEHSPSFSNTTRMQLQPYKTRMDRKTDASFLSRNATCIWLLKAKMSWIAGNVRLTLHANSQTPRSARLVMGPPMPLSAFAQCAAHHMRD